MKNIFKLLFVLTLSLAFAFANAPTKEHKKLPLTESLPLLKSIKDKAINIGKGETEVYVFVDPLCPRSQEFISLISESMRMQKLYSYHIFLYELKRFNSLSLIKKIYGSKNSLDALQKVMVKKEPLESSLTSKKVDEAIKSIEDVAHKLNVYKRPYLVLVKKGKK